MRSDLKSPDISEVNPEKAIPEKAAKTPAVSPKVCETINKWFHSKGSEPVIARGVFKYGYIATNDTRCDATNVTLTVSEGKILGSAQDSSGASQIEGHINQEAGTIRFTKSYGASNLWAKWEYNGRFTEWGIVGIWHSPGRPNSWTKGRFVLWLDGDDALPKIVEGLADAEKSSPVRSKE